MTITLTIVNADMLPKGAPAFYRATRHGFHIGRDQQLDWTLPDPSRRISGRHCEIRFENGGYYLYDRSTNGVFLNGSSERMRSPFRLSDGDRLAIGSYIVRVAVEGDPAGHTLSEFAPSAHGRDPAPKDAEGRGTGSPDRPLRREPAFVVQTDQAEARDAAASAACEARDIRRDEAARYVTGAGSGQPTAEAFVDAFCRGAGIAPEMLAARDQNVLAEEIGEFVKLTVEHLGELLRARATAKAMVKSSNRTMIGRQDNNPLKFVPSPPEVIEAMFAGRRSGYLDARASLEEAFGDLKQHETATYTAMQKALARLLDPLAPEVIETKAQGSAFTSSKARAWDLFVQRWGERNAGENGMLDAFLAYFSEAYDEATGKK
ncbi:type VI secretion protein [Mesorhizobium sp. L-8-10]|uniref:type VI secretion system-associated FHA domain protein TagH n=1 Tax=Mesorhizobium sp. L-8-10 TaxID=2744523 RepID=UPI0019283A6E|nr:type VI secretion system-associated FHA domain protein TagH [Mesorhizobium sp. L-8-10]BCH33458.1 type VI secretion protein [Mesorhizobium sp. L-8-10]